MKNKFLFVLLLLISISVVSFCSTFFYVKYNKVEVVETDMLIMTSCNPVYLAACNVVGDIDGITVENLSQPTTGCLHDYTLTTEDMKNLAAADVLCGRTLTAYPAVGPDVKLAGGTYVEVAPDESVVDGNLVTSPAWPGNTAILKEFICLLEQQ